MIDGSAAGGGVVGDGGVVNKSGAGCVDGDGGISGSGKNIQLYFCGTYDMVDGFIKFIENKLYVRKRLPRKAENIYQTCYGGKKALEVMNFLYSGCDIYLDRKMQLVGRETDVA